MIWIGLQYNPDVSMPENQDKDGGPAAPKSIESLNRIHQAGQDQVAVNLIKDVEEKFGDLADRQAIMLSLAHLVRSLPDQSLSEGWNSWFRGHRLGLITWDYNIEYTKATY